MVIDICKDCLDMYNKQKLYWINWNGVAVGIVACSKHYGEVKEKLFGERDRSTSK